MEVKNPQIRRSKSLKFGGQKASNPEVSFVENFLDSFL